MSESDKPDRGQFEDIEKWDRENRRAQPEPAAPESVSQQYLRELVHEKMQPLYDAFNQHPNTPDTIKTEADSFCDLHCADEHAPGCVRAEPVAFAYYWPPTNTLRRNPAYQLDCSPMTVWKDEIPLFTSPPRTALTQDRIVDLAASYQLDFGRWSFINVLELESFARAVIEAAHGITERKP
jgi:hypothetical protein